MKGILTGSTSAHRFKHGVTQQSMLTSATLKLDAPRPRMVPAAASCASARHDSRHPPAASDARVSAPVHTLPSQQQTSTSTTAAVNNFNKSSSQQQQCT